LVLWLWSDLDPKSAGRALLLTCLLVTLDAWHVAIPIITTSVLHEDAVWAGARINVPTGADARVIAPPGFENLASVTGHLNVAGYDPLPIDAYQKLRAYGDANDPTTPVSTLLGVKYVLTTKPYDKPNFKLIGIADGGIYYRREDAFPRAWLAQTIIVEPNDDAVRAKIAAGKNDLRTIVYLSKPLDCPIANGATNPTAEITDYHADTVAVKTSGGGVLVLSDQYYNGWRATIDGQPADIQRADTVFRAVCVPAGDHVVRFEYRPLSLYVGVIVSIVGWLSVLALLLLGFMRDRRARSV